MARIIPAAVLAALLSCAPTSAATATPPGPTALGSTPGRMVVAPRPDAQLLHAPVHVAVRVPQGTTRLVVRLEGRNVSARFRSAGATRRVASLSPGSGLRYGRNHLVVEARRGALRPRVQARTFFLARR